MSNPYSQKLRSSKAFLLAVLFTILSVVQTIGQTLSVVPTTAPGTTVNDDFMPLGTFWGFQRSQMQYSDAELNTAGLNAVPTGGHWITQVSFYVSNATGRTATTPVVIRMKQSLGVPGLAANLYSVASSGYSQVFNGSVNSSLWATGTWVMITLTTPFYYTYTGTNNLEVIVETNFGGSGSVSENATPTTWARTSIIAPNNNRFQRWTADGLPPNGTGILSTDRPDIRLTYYKETVCTAPGAITTVASAVSVCSAPAQQFTLSLTGVISPPASVPGGYTYVWQSGPTAGGPWTTISPGPTVWSPTATAPTIVLTQSVATYYHCLITCGSTSTSSALLVGALQCYCIPGTNFTNDTDIGQVIFGGLTNPAVLGSTTNNPLASNSYTDYTAVATPCYTQGFTYTFTVSQITSGGTFWTAVAHVFVDWDNDGILSSSEDTYLPGPTGPQGSAPTTTSLTTSITIPWTATPGNHRMRVVLRETCCGSAGGPTNQACDVFNWGEIEDYTICVLAGAPCNVTAAGTSTSTAPAVCPLQPFILNITGNVGYGSGMTFQWQVSTGGVGGPYSDIVGANAYPYTIANQAVASCYRLKITCPANSAGAPQYTTPICVGQNSATLCLCVPPHPACPSSPFISNVVVNTLNNTSACTNGNAAAYTIYPPGVGTTTNLTQGAGYFLGVTTQSGSAIVSVWIDFNADGVLAPTEWWQVGTNIPANTPFTIPITIPLTATPGQCVMRVRSRAAGSPNASVDACTTFFSGESEDYIVTIIAAAPTPCTAVNSAGRTITSLQSYSNICAGTQLTFSLTPSLTSPTVYSGLTYLWETAPAIGGPWGAAPGLNNAGTYTNIFSVNTFLRCTITCSAGGTYTTAAVSITTIPTSWLGFDDDWSNGINWCGRVPTIADPTQISKAAAIVLRGGAAAYFFPVAALRDTVTALSLTVSNQDSMTVITDTLVKVNIVNDLTNNGKVALLSSAQAADTATIGNGAVVSSIFGQIFRGNQNDNIVQVLYNITELTSIGLQVGNIIDTVMFQMRNRSSGGAGFQNFTISYAQVPIATLSSFATANPYVGAFTTIYSSAALFTNAPTQGQWTPYTSPVTRAFTGSTTTGSAIITGVVPNPTLAASQVFLGDTIFSPSLVPYGIVTAVGTTTITVNITATSTVPSGAITSKNSGGWLRLASTQNPFVWNGVDNIVLQICYNNGVTNATSIDEMLFTSTAPTKTALFLSNGLTGAANDGCTLTSASPFLTSTFGQSPSSNRPNITFRFRNSTNRLTATVGGQILNNAGSSLWVSSSDLLIGSNLTNAGSVTFMDSSYTQIAGDMTSTGSLQATNIAVTRALTATTTLGSATLTLVSPNTNAVYVGDIVSGAGIPAGSIVVSKTINSITINQTATITAAGVATTVNNLTKRPAIQFNGTNWTNSGTMIPGNSRVTFGTATSQTIGGTNPSSFYDFNMQKTNNADAITMNKAISVNDSITLRLGQLRMNKNAITVNNSNASGISRQLSGTALLATTVTSATVTTVTPASVVGIGIGDLIVNANLSTSPIPHVTGIAAGVITYFPAATVAPVAASAISFYKAGYVIGEDSLSKVNWLIDAVTGPRTVPFANITTNGAANPLHIPINFNLAVTNPVDMDTVSFATYKAINNLPFPPTVTHLNSAGPATKTLIGNIVSGNNTISGIATTAGVAIGDLVSGPGIPTGATVVSTTGTTIVMSVNAVSTLVGIVFSTGLGIPAGSNNDLYTGERFWILGKSSPLSPSIQANTTSASTIITGVTSTAGILAGQSIFGAGIAAGTTVVSVVLNTSVTMSAAATSTVVGNNITFNYPLTALTFTLAYDERPCLNGSSPWTCADRTLNPLRPQPWYKQFTPSVQESWKRLSFSVPVATPYTFGTFQNLAASLPNTNLNATVNNYPWIYGNYTPWAITTQSNPLPIELVSFEANLKGEDVLLNWSTASEKNNDFFTIERTLDFEKITDVSKVSSYGDGNSSSLQNYSTWDFEPVKGAINYYRLRQTDIDGTTTISSDYVPVRIGLQSVFEIKYVNIDNTIDVIFDYDSDAPVYYTLYDITDKIVSRGNGLAAKQGINMLKIDGSQLARGMYMISLRNNQKVISRKFVY